MKVLVMGVLVTAVETSRQKDTTLLLPVSKIDDFDGNWPSLGLGKLSSGREM